MLFEGQVGKWPVLATDRDLRARGCVGNAFEGMGVLAIEWGVK